MERLAGFAEMRWFLAAAVLVAMAAPVAAGTSAACEEDLANVSMSFDETLARLDSVANADTDAKCSAYRHHIDVMSAGREVFMRCLAGHDRSENVGQLEDSITDFRVVVGRLCPNE